jgi:hypothetical protein
LPFESSGAARRRVAGIIRPECAMAFIVKFVPFC